MHVYCSSRGVLLVLPAWCLLDFVVSLFFTCICSVYGQYFCWVFLMECGFFALSEVLSSSLGFSPGGHWPKFFCFFIFGLALPGVLAVLFTCVLTNVMCCCCFLLLFLLNACSGICGFVDCVVLLCF